MRSPAVSSIFLALALLTSANAQEQPETPSSTTTVDGAATELSDALSLQATRLDEIARLIDTKIEQRDELRQTLDGAAENTLLKERATLVGVEKDIERLGNTFEIIALGETDTSPMAESTEEETNWQQDLIEVLNPVIESLKSLTKRPRQLAELRDALFTTKSRLAVASQALEELQTIPSDALDPTAASRISNLAMHWQNQQEQFEQELLVTQTQLDRLTEDQESFFEGVWPATRNFLLGRGLTLIIAAIAAVAVWALMRFFWWVYQTHFTSKEQRRNQTWFRLLSYGYYLLTSIVVFLSVVVVLYVREDLLLLALSLLLVFGAVLSFRQFLPRYIKEVRLLLNLGSAREDERVIYNGLPWQIMSLNLHSVLRNPALDGVIRLPLEAMSTLISRPVKNNLWFPSNKGDFVILPDGMLGQIRTQTPDMVELAVRGGMSMTYNTTDFYSINLINLSREETFGVAVTFGFDYALQNISLSEIPEALKLEVTQQLSNAGYGKHSVALLVELSEANTSSLDFLVFATFSSKIASDFYKLHRLIQQACVAVSNDRGWTIPFPQLTVHQATD